MEKGINPEEMIIKPVNFHSNMEVNLDGTDEQELYVTMVERILEKLATFQNEGSQWRLRSIIRLELHTVSYNPLRGETWILLCIYPVLPSSVHVCIYFEWFPLWLFLELDFLLWNIVLEVSGPFYSLITRNYATDFNMNFLDVSLLL